MLKNLKTGDKFLIAAVIAAIIAAAAINVRSFGSPSIAPDNVMVFSKGKEWGKFNFAENQVIDVSGALVEIRGGRVRIIKNDCSRQLCMRSVISRPGEAIICVPKRLVVEITGEKHRVDSVTY